MRTRGAVTSISLALPLSLALTAVSGCESSPTSSGSNPSVSGFGIGTLRTVSRGDEVVIRLPASVQTGTAEWRLSSFDSGLLRLSQPVRLERTGRDGSPEWTIRFVARTPGDTEVILVRAAVGPNGTGSVGDRRRFRIRIRG